MKRCIQGAVFTDILTLRIRIFLEFFSENSKNKTFWYSLNSYSLNFFLSLEFFLGIMFKSKNDRNLT